MNFDERFSNARIDEGIKGEAIKKGLKTAAGKAAAGAKAFGAKAKSVAGKAKEGAKVGFNKAKAFAKDPRTKLAASGAALGWSARGIANKLAAKKKAKNESLVEAMDRHITNMQNEAAIGAALKGAAGKVGAAAKNLGSKAAAGAKKAGAELKAVGKNTVQGAKTVGGAIKKHPYRTAAVVGGAAGLGAGAVGAKKAYDNWKS